MEEINKQEFTEAIQWIFKNLDAKLTRHIFSELYPSAHIGSFSINRATLNRITNRNTVNRYLKNTFTFPKEWPIDSDKEVSEEQLKEDMALLEFNPVEQAFGHLLANHPAAVINLYRMHHLDKINIELEEGPNLQEEKVEGLSTKEANRMQKLKDENLELKKEKGDFIKQVSDQSKQLVVLKKKLEKKDKDIQSLENTNQSIEGIQKELRIKTVEINTLKRKVDGDLVEISRLKNLIADQEKELKRLTDENATYRISQEKYEKVYKRQLLVHMKKNKLYYSENLQSNIAIIGTIEHSELPSHIYKKNPTVFHNTDIEEFIEKAENFKRVLILTWQFPQFVFEQYAKALSIQPEFIESYISLEAVKFN